MPEIDPKTLAEFKSKGYVIAPAGYGKTHLIADAVKLANDRQLILTHTFAGVNSIKMKLNKLGVPSAKYQVDTIASWTLRLCLSYPKTSGWNIENPSSEQWNSLYDSGRCLMEKEFIKHIICCTFTGIYVDEYQDCNEQQHSLVCAMAEFLPCRILGDPLQAIFDFDENPVDWKKSIYPHFTCLGELETPWRWKNKGADELGLWLKKARTALMENRKVSLNAPLPEGIFRVWASPDYLSSKQYSSLCEFLKKEDSVIAIHAGDAQSKNKTHLLARSLAGKFSSIEEVEGKALSSFLKKYQSSKTVSVAFIHALDFAKKCFTGVDKALAAGTKKGEVAKQTKATKYPDLLDAANTYLIEPTSRKMLDYFNLLKNNPDTHIYRRDLLYRFLHVLRIHIEGGAPTLLESAAVYQTDFRHSGRPIRHNKLIGTTLLVKGLEYDHAVILDGDSLSANHLYVAMTRGSKSLTIISNKNQLPTE
jgi:hypothetical protein